MLIGQMNCALCGSIPFGWEHTVRSETEHVCTRAHPTRAGRSVFVQTASDAYGLLSTEGIVGPAGVEFSRKATSVAQTHLGMAIGKNDLAT